MEQATILIVDDDPNIRELLSVNLQAEGFAVVAAEDGAAALEKAIRIRPQVVVLDIMMPEMDGWELCKELRDDPVLADVKIIMLTAKDTERDKMIGKQILKADAYITKPFEIENLVAAIRTQLHAHA